MLMDGISYLSLFLAAQTHMVPLRQLLVSTRKETIVNTESVSRLLWAQKDGFVALQERNNWGGHTP